MIVLVRRRWLAMLALLVALCFVGCSSDDPRLDPVVDKDYPCGPYMDRYSHFLDNYVLAWTPDGSQLVLIYGTDIWVVDDNGTRLRKLVDVNPSPAYSGHFLLFGVHFEISPDGTRITYVTCEYEIEPKPVRRLFSEREAYHYEIAVMGLDNARQMRLTVNPYLDHYPMWSPDGSRIAFIGERIDEESRRLKYGLYTMAADGSDVRQVQPQSSVVISLFPPVWLANGETLAFWGYEEGDTPTSFIYTVRTDGSELTRIAASPRSNSAWSPDNERFAVAHISDEDADKVGLYTRAADGSDPRLLTTITDRKTLEELWGPYGLWIRLLSWSPDGTHILYHCDLVICVVNVEDGEVIGLLDGATVSDRAVYKAAWSPDGSRIAIYTSGDGRDVSPQLYTVARNGTDRRDLIHLDDDGNLAPANPSQEGP